MSRRLRRIGDGELAKAERALRGAGLPADGLDAAAFFELSDADGAVGWAALERHGADALLRSVVVAEQWRGKGAGADLVERIARAAADEGVERLWLLTETAAPFFAALGFETASREAAPDAIRRTGEFATLCPSSAACMTLSLGGR